MFCEKCGSKISDGAGFCSVCGAPVMPAAAPAPGISQASSGSQETASNVPPAAPPVSPGIRLCADGVYRWIYEVPMLKNLVILETIWALIAGCGGLVYLVMVIGMLVTGSFDDIGDFLRLTMIFAIVGLVVLALAALAYLVLARLIYGMKYVALFEMDEKEVRHIQMQKQFEKARALLWLEAAAGMALGDLTAAGASIYNASRDRTVTEYDKVKQIRSDRSKDLIRIGRPFFENHIFAEPADYDFVYDYLASHCTTAAKIC
jgi:hypothetical protein